MGRIRVEVGDGKKDTLTAAEIRGKITTLDTHIGKIRARASKYQAQLDLERKLSPQDKELLAKGMAAFRIKKDREFSA